MRKLYKVWTDNLKTEDEKERFEQALRNDTLVLGRLQEILDIKLTELESQETKFEDYKDPSWAYKQAHRNGYKSGLKFVEDLLSFLD